MDMEGNMTVTDGMIERMKNAVEGELDGLAIETHHARAILEYVLSASPAGVVKPKPLEWEHREADSANYERWYSQTMVGWYCIYATPDGFSWFLRGVTTGAVLPTLEAAKSAAFADYSARIMSAIEPVGVGVETVETYFERQIEWSRETFGPALRTGGVIDHIRKDLHEIEADPHDLSEWVDVVILAMDGFWRHGGKASDLLPALLAKQRKNMARTWPDWRAMSENSAIEHDRSHDDRAALKGDEQ